MRRRTLYRLRDGFLPLAGLIACLAGRGDAVAALMGSYLLARLCALCPDGAYLRSVADELDMDMLSRLRATALLISMLGGLAAALLSALAVRLLPSLSGLLARTDQLLFWCAGFFILGARIFAAFLTSDSEWDHALLSDFLLAALLLTALLLGSPGWKLGALADGSWDTPLFCAVAALLVFVAGDFLTARARTFASPGFQRPAAKLFRRSPMALLREMLCPLLLGAMVGFAGVGLLPAALAGWTVFAVSATLYRRSREETAGMAALLVPGTALLTALALAVMLFPGVFSAPALRDLAEARLFGLRCAAWPIALGAALALLFNAGFSPLLFVCGALLLLQGALPSLAALPHRSVFSLTAGILAALCAVPFIREALTPLRARRLREKLRQGRPNRTE